MIKNLKVKIKGFKKGVTLIEILVVLFIISIFSSILIIDFPKLKNQLALNRAVYKLSGDLKKVQDLGGSGFLLVNSDGQAISVKGYGIYINTYSGGNKNYIMYADVNGDEQYNTEFDYIMENINLDSVSEGTIIKGISNANSFGLSINFKAPNFSIKISDLAKDKDGVEIIFATESNQDKTRTVYVNKLGLIEVR